jgi:stress response protein YsnF
MVTRAPMQSMRSKCSCATPSVSAPVADVKVSAIQEQLSVGTVEAETGAVRVRKVVSDETRLISVELHTRTVGVTRVSVNRPVDAECGPRQEGDSLIVPIFEYVPIVTTQLTLKEEVRITTHTLEKEDLWQVPVKLETIVVERRHARCRGSFLSVRSIPCRQPPVPPHERC